MGLIHLDAGVVIGFLDADDAHHRSASRALAEFVKAGDHLAMSASAFAECLVGPSRRGPGAVDTVEQLFARLPVRVVELDAGIARLAAALRARHTALRLPDALVIATATNDRAERLVTTDRKWPTARRMGAAFPITHL